MVSFGSHLLKMIELLLNHKLEIEFLIIVFKDVLVLGLLLNDVAVVK